jgi:SAM-dependent methyltransferase
MTISLIVERKLKRIFKVMKGTYYTITAKGAPWEANFWDNEFYTEDISDEKTIGSKKNKYSSLYHYTSTEMQIFRHFVNQKMGEIGSVLDLGSGAGHWIDFYRRLGSPRVVGIEVSKKCVRYLSEKYQDDLTTTIYQGKIDNVLKNCTSDKFDIVNAIGVLFHIIDDKELIKVLTLTYNVLNNKGILVIGGNFGLWPININTQVKQGRIINKRLRSRFWWNHQLRNIGFKKIRLYRNIGYAFINDRTPENSILVCQKVSSADCTPEI